MFEKYLVLLLLLIHTSQSVDVVTKIVNENTVVILADVCFGDSDSLNTIYYSSHTNDPTDLSFVVYSENNWGLLQSHTDLSCQEKLILADFKSEVYNDRNMVQTIKTSTESHWYVSIANCGFASTSYRIQYATTRQCGSGLQPIYFDFIFLGIIASLVIAGSIWGYVRAWRKMKKRDELKDQEMLMMREVSQMEFRQGTKLSESPSKEPEKIPEEVQSVDVQPVPRKPGSPTLSRTQSTAKLTVVEIPIHPMVPLDELEDPMGRLKGRLDDRKFGRRVSISSVPNPPNGGENV